MKKKTFAWALVLCATFSLTTASCGGSAKNSSNNSKPVEDIKLADCPKFCSDSAMLFIQEQCNFGPRITASEASQLCGDYIVAKFKQFGANVEEQTDFVRIYDGTKMKARNILASINPDNTDRILICSHWDSRPWADNDPEQENHKKPILGANDGASGVAVMLEMCRLFQQQSIDTGIDFVCFDAEDLGTPYWEEDRDDSENTWCLGSKMWAEKTKEKRYHARYGILLDMVGGRGSTFSKEQISVQYAEPIVEQLWQTANAIGYGYYFPASYGGFLIDDHVNVNRIARIPCLDIVPYFEEGPSSFGPTWHTLSDTPENIDPNVLEAVGQSLMQLLYNDAAE